MGYNLLTVVAILVAVYGVIRLYKDSKQSNGEKSFVKRIGLTLVVSYVFVSMIIFLLI
ncbi:hypothetical protein KP77_04690 [Jeotgalibacillus alimentarius]|uniref:Uncharacterized protein n=1 Tax=Jeotgalibacillus alimentarius TaxID=135826 RepID=A0A0C2WBU0_9BACL|nr:hypothetical protein [Jeotgalibacillus alimentarius]KIL53493.1 hypothetical protein KP77_04690 [Jeotgalibacillus alimentarius]